MSMRKIEVAGSVLFLLSSAVKDVRRNYKAYVRNRANEYAGTSWGSEGHVPHKVQVRADSCHDVPFGSTCIACSLLVGTA